MSAEIILMIIYTIVFIAIMAYAVYDLKKTATKFEESRRAVEEAIDYLAKSTQQEVELKHIKLNPLEPMEWTPCDGDCDECGNGECVAEAVSPPETEE